MRGDTPLPPRKQFSTVRRGIALVPDTVAIRITLPGIRLKRTIIRRIGHAIVVIIEVATIADAVTVGISLILIRRELAVILIVGYSVVVVITVATIADAVVI